MNSDNRPVLPFAVSRNDTRTLVVQVTDGLIESIVSGRYRAVLAYLKTGTFPTGVAVQPQWCPGETFSRASMMFCGVSR